MHSSAAPLTHVKPRCVHVDTDATEERAPPPNCHVPSNKQRETATHSVESYDIYIPHRPVSVGIALRLYQALNLGQAAFFRSKPPPLFSFLSCHYLTRTCSRLTKRTPNMYLAPVPQKKNGLLAFRRGTRSVKGEKNMVHFSPSIPPSILPSLLSRPHLSRGSHSPSPRNSVYQGSPAPFVFANPPSRARSIILPSLSTPWNISSLLSP